LNARRIRSAAVLAPLWIALIAWPAAAQDRADKSAEHSRGRWLDAQTLTLATRYNHIEDGRDRTLQNRLQTQVQIRARFKIDAAARYSVNLGLFTGNGFGSGWNSTGVGTGDGTAKINLKQLFLAAEPWRGLELQYGSLPPERGQSTEITTYDNDAYFTAGRITVRHPRELFFDAITVSAGYVGYRDRPFVFDRTGAFSRQNYWQLLASKQLFPGLTLSSDYSVIGEDGMLRQGAKWRVHRSWLETVAGEYGVRVRGGSHQTAFAFTGERQVAGATVQLGYSNVDPVFGVLNGDPYGRGNRVFMTGSHPLPLDLRASWFAQKELSPPITSTNDLRFDLVLTWNVLKTLARAGTVPREPSRH
jgi:hypothetical protein